MQRCVGYHLDASDKTVLEDSLFQHERVYNIDIDTLVSMVYTSMVCVCCTPDVDSQLQLRLSRQMYNPTQHENGLGNSNEVCRPSFFYRDSIETSLRRRDLGRVASYRNEGRRDQILNRNDTIIISVIIWSLNGGAIQQEK